MIILAKKNFTEDPFGLDKKKNFTFSPTQRSIPAFRISLPGLEVQGLPSYDPFQKR